ncbi:AAA family ATPase [Brachyspira murdochii]|uniref:ABC transporter ATP-binding protein n=1 Tax=Brachyspira murdochii (strain ATCC 51284 / DSM 12563 / 56-150) TaxID=526224 RepID=D5UAZ0_BRAM5|nr:ATP-binding protein [Brachyspira murdochii]ADG71863.1 ABC transporter ATP-binding protein [Brachyspira murdochii DSM 12563]
MKLTIKNFARIKEAEINIDGITIIAGENNTGKTTVGKVLFSCFNSFNNLEKEIYLDREFSVQKELCNLHDLLVEYKINNYEEYGSLEYKLDDMSDNLYSIYIKSKKNIYDILIDNLKGYIDLKDKNIIDYIKKSSKKIEEYINISDEKIAYEKIEKYFNEMFNNQINSRIERNTIAEINILDLCFKFKDDEFIETNLNYHYDRNIYFIDNPFIFDRNDYFYSLSISESHLINNILHSERQNTLDKILAEEKLKNIYDKLSYAVNGKIVEKDKDFYLEEDFFYEPISVHNLSAGLKSFAIIKMLLERNALKEDDILILDEPEIHLHPKWQLLYAEIIVLLQKEFNIYILITTHSPYFLEAIEMYSKSHGIEEKTNYYLADIENKHSVFKLVNDSIEDIYNIMAQPIEKLEDLQNSFK